MKNLNLKTLGTVFLLITAMMSIVAGQAPQQPKFLIMNTLKEDAGYVLQEKTLDQLMQQPGGIGDYDIRSMAATKERAEKALQKIKQLIDGGTPETETIEIAGNKMTLGELTEKIFALHRDAAKVGVMSEIYQAGIGASAWLEDLNSEKKLQMDDVDVILIQGKRLQKVVGEANKLGFPADYTQKLRGQDYTLPQLKEMADYVTTAGGQIQKALLAELAAKDAPFLNVLTGDKLRIFKQEFANLKGQWECYGSGGRLLTTPEAMKSAAVWYTYGNSRGIIDTWHITGYRFSGDRLVGTISRSGYGLRPAAANFK